MAVPDFHDAASVLVGSVLLVGFVDCGARTELDVAQHVDAGKADVRDASVDAQPYMPLLATDTRHACYRSSAGDLLCWGGSPNGQFASDGGFVTVSQPTPVTTNGVPTVVSAHQIGQCILLANGTVDCWGYDDEYQRLGDGSGKPQPPPGVPIITNATDLIGSPNGDFECARTPSSLACWGYPPDCDATYPDAGYPATPALRPDLAMLDSLALGQQFLCGIEDSSVYCCGWQNSGELGDGVQSYDFHDALEAVPLPANAAHAFVGAGDACAILDDATAWCWGWNGDGQLGDGTMGVNRASPVQVVGLGNVAQLALGVDHSCALLTDGTARCWGANSHGQLGDGTTTRRLTAHEVTSLSEIVDLHAGYDFTCALVASGDVYCWGWNNEGQIGDGTTTDRFAPTKVIGLQ
jgi:alpha-tubulin suppressor-like RCC1 family protein